jgi:hypothetical protein
MMSGYTAAFDGTVTPAPGPNVQYAWWFSDNNTTSTLQDPVHTFSGPGTYMVCFSVYDAVANCMDSVCQMVVVSGGCNVDFIAIDSLLNVSFYSTTTAPQPAQYVWDFGDGNFSNAQHPSHTYANPGSYTVCVTVYDSLQNFCDSTCHVVNVQNQPNGCVTNFTAIDSMGYVFFFGSSTLGPSGYYLWDFGDGNYSTSMNPSHVYPSPGIYTVCLIAYDSLQNFCDSTCQTLQISAVGIADAAALQASLLAAPNPADGNLSISFATLSSGTAVISFYDAAGRLAAEENVNASAGGYTRTEINTTTIPQGIYLVKIAVNGNAAWTRVAITHQSHPYSWDPDRTLCIRITVSRSAAWQAQRRAFG